jgi:hypothetical protein
LELESWRWRDGELERWRLSEMRDESTSTNCSILPLHTIYHESTLFPLEREREEGEGEKGGEEKRGGRGHNRILVSSLGKMTIARKLG